MKYLRWRPDGHYGAPEAEISDNFVMPFTYDELLSYYEDASYSTFNMMAGEGVVSDLFEEYGDFPVFHWVYILPDTLEDDDITNIESEISDIASDKGFMSDSFSSSVEDYDSAFPPGTIMFGGEWGFTMRSLGDKYDGGAEGDIVKEIAIHMKSNLDSSFPVDYDKFLVDMMNHLPGLKAELDSLGFDWERAKSLSKRARMLGRE